ncbi:MAG: chemotaxis protein CheW [Xenococcaceae cyanobacterium MO_207.B15]|nr:chemotaxis protein CheW [Xenococcaceae cyanobacterium MO_207.B15]MDJ0743243.1 chemotaxis protein CheW [Xenococcaceae cyanobacterium MO_167.B27]
MNKITLTRSEIESLWADNLEQDTSKPYVKLALEANKFAVLPMDNAKEVLLVSSQRISPVPNMSNYILGLINQRSHIFWVVDLPYMLGMQPIARNQQSYHLAIVRSNNIPLGLVVTEVQGVIHLSHEEIQSPVGTVSPRLVPYLKGCSLQKDQLFLVLDAEAIVNSPILSSES